MGKNGVGQVKTQVRVGDVVTCWGVGCDKRGDRGMITKIDLSKTYPYRITIFGKNDGAGLWYSRDDFNVMDAAHYTDVSQLSQWRKENE